MPGPDSLVILLMYNFAAVITSMVLNLFVWSNESNNSSLKLYCNNDVKQQNIQKFNLFSLNLTLFFIYYH